MHIDHIFIFSNQQGREADELVKFGFTEGSSRMHPGQGTTNRKFYFDNFFLEILWVISEEEIRSPITSMTKLWERSQFSHNGCAPFGLCLTNTAETDKLFAESERYQPAYFPNGMTIDIITNQNSPYLPWTFRLPYLGPQKVADEPRHHQNGIQSLTKVAFEIPDDHQNQTFLDAFNSTEMITFQWGEQLNLMLEFDHGMQKKEKTFKDLSLKIRY